MTCSVQDADLRNLLHLLKNTETLSEETLASLSILMSDFQASLASMQPSAKREGFATVPDVTWEDVGALLDVREELTMAILVSTCIPLGSSLAGTRILRNVQMFLKAPHSQSHAG